jgi:hypothetical protein
MPPRFSMKALRNAHTRVIAAREGWLKRRNTSSKVFPFRLLSVVKKAPVEWSCEEYFVIGVFLIIVACIVLAVS